MENLIEKTIYFLGGLAIISMILLTILLTMGITFTIIYDHILPELTKIFFLLTNVVNY